MAIAWTINGVTTKDNLLILDTLQDATPHTIYIPAEAVASRMLAYGLSTPREAVTAIMREHGKRLSGLSDLGQTKQDVMGGLDTRTTVTITPAATIGIGSALTQFKQQIDAALAARKPPTP